MKTGKVKSLQSCQQWNAKGRER